MKALNYSNMGTEFHSQSMNKKKKSWNLQNLFLQKRYFYSKNIQYIFGKNNSFNGTTF